MDAVVVGAAAAKFLHIPLAGKTPLHTHGFAGLDFSTPIFFKAVFFPRPAEVQTLLRNRCSICKSFFKSRKTLRFHLKTHHVSLPESVNREIVKNWNRVITEEELALELGKIYLQNINAFAWFLRKLDTLIVRNACEVVVPARSVIRSASSPNPPDSFEPPPLFNEETISNEDTFVNAAPSSCPVLLSESFLDDFKVIESDRLVFSKIMLFCMAEKNQDYPDLSFIMSVSLLKKFFSVHSLGASSQRRHLLCIRKVLAANEINESSDFQSLYSSLRQLTETGTGHKPRNCDSERLLISLYPHFKTSLANISSSNFSNFYRNQFSQDYVLAFSFLAFKTAQILGHSVTSKLHFLPVLSNCVAISGLDQTLQCHLVQFAKIRAKMGGPPELFVNSKLKAIKSQDCSSQLRGILKKFTG